MYGQQPGAKPHLFNQVRNKYVTKASSYLTNSIDHGIPPAPVCLVDATATTINLLLWLTHAFTQKKYMGVVCVIGMAGRVDFLGCCHASWPRLLASRYEINYVYIDGYYGCCRPSRWYFDVQCDLVHALRQLYTHKCMYIVSFIDRYLSSIESRINWVINMHRDWLFRMAQQLWNLFPTGFTVNWGQYIFIEPSFEVSRAVPANQLLWSNIAMDCECKDMYVANWVHDVDMQITIYTQETGLSVGDRRSQRISSE